MRIVVSLARAVLFASLCVLPSRAALGQGADAPKVVTPALDFSGVIYGNFRYAYDDVGNLLSISRSSSHTSPSASE